VQPRILHRIQTRVVNGNREISVIDGEKRIRITDSQGKDITVKVSEQVDGEEKTSEYKAKDLDELKEKHPEAAKLYEQYANRANNPLRERVRGLPPRIRFGQVLPEGDARPVPGRPAPADARPGANRPQIEAAHKRLQRAAEDLRKLAGRGDLDADELRRLADELDAAARALQRAQTGLPE
jgi:hypothetical protein